MEYDSVISTCTSEVAVHTKTTPHALAVDRLFTVPLKVKGPKRSTAVDEKTGAGPILCSGKGAMICSPVTLKSLLQKKQLFLITLASRLAAMIHTCDLLRITIASNPAWSMQ